MMLLEQIEKAVKMSSGPKPVQPRLEEQLREASTDRAELAEW